MTDSGRTRSFEARESPAESRHSLYATALSAEEVRYGLGFAFSLHSSCSGTLYGCRVHPSPPLLGASSCCALAASAWGVLLSATGKLQALPRRALFCPALFPGDSNPFPEGRFIPSSMMLQLPGKELPPAPSQRLFGEQDTRTLSVPAGKRSAIYVRFQYLNQTLQTDKVEGFAFNSP